VCRDVERIQRSGEEEDGHESSASEYNVSEMNDKETDVR
jgi:hypothetical protein